MIAAKKEGAKTTPATVTLSTVNECELDHHVKNSIWNFDNTLNN